MNEYSLQRDYNIYEWTDINETYQVDTDHIMEIYRKLINEMPHWIWITNSHRRIVYSNFFVNEIIGYDTNEVMGLPITDLLFSSEFNGIDIHSLLTKLIHDNKHRITLNHRIQHRDQSIRYLKTLLIPNYNSTTGEIGIMGITNDQTSQMIAKKALKESEQKLQLVLSNLSEIVFLIDARGLITFISPTVERILGITQEEVLGKSPYEIYRSLNPDNFYKLIKKSKQAIRNREQEFSDEIELKINGRICIFDILVRILYDSRENYIGFTGVIRDVTNRRRAEADITAAFNGAIDAIALIVEQRDVYTSGHQCNVSKLSVAIAQELGLNRDRIEGLRIAAMLHDVGKVSIPKDILNRPTKLNKIERRIIEMHPKLGANILRQIPFPWNIARFVEEHHERVDGSGYPKGLKDNEISLEARIIGAADTLDSIINHRPYKPAQDIKKAIKIISDGRGVKFDVNVVNAILVLYQKRFFKS